MQTETVRSAALGMKQSSETMGAQLQSIRQALQNLQITWEGSASDQFNAEADAMLRTSIQLQEAIAILSVRLEREVQEWEQVDQRGAAAFRGSLFGAGWLSSGIGLPVTAGGSTTSSMTFAILPLMTALSVSQLLTGIPSWLSGFLDRFFPPPTIISPLADNLPSSAPKAATSSAASTFGDLLKKPPSESSPNATSSAQPATQPQAAPADNKYDIYYDVPTESQGDLYGSAACSPTAAVMVMDYFHAKDPANQTVTPSKLVGMLDKSDGTPGKGMPLTNITDELNSLGYKDISVKVNANMQDLKSELNTGPVIVTSGVSIVGPGTIKSDVPRAITGPGSVGHALVVKGVSADTVAVNDPWSGSSMDIPMNTFSKMWNNGENAIYAIRP